jgi:hypothetical protein
MKIEVGKSYKTRGGWKAKVIYCLDLNKYVVIHYNYNGEICQFHDEKGFVQLYSVIFKPAETFSSHFDNFGILHPADLIEEIE